MVMSLKGESVVEDNIERIRKDIEIEAKKISPETEPRISYNHTHVTKLLEAGLIKPELYAYYIKDIAERELMLKKIQEYNAKASSEKLEPLFQSRTLTASETTNIFENILKSLQLFTAMVENKEFLELNDTDFPPKLYKNIPEDEFPISRLIADPLNHFLKIKNNKVETIQTNEDTYLCKLSSKDSYGNTLNVTRRIKASSHEEATKQWDKFLKKIGRYYKIIEACSAMCYRKCLRICTCDLTDIMATAYPHRDKLSFTVHERAEFYQDMLDAEETSFEITKIEKKKKSSKNIDTYRIPFITIFKTTSEIEETSTKESQKYPKRITFSPLHNPIFEKEKLYTVGAGIKYSTLELNIDDTPLAQFIQVRKSQLSKKKFIQIDRPMALKLANLEGTKHTGSANRRLLEKLGRLKEKGIIIDFPKRITDLINLKIR